MASPMSTLKVMTLLTMIVYSLCYDVEKEIRKLKMVLGDEPVGYEPLSEHKERHKRRFSDTYCNEKLGCFPLNDGFSERPFNLKPNSREIVDTQFQLFTRKNPTTAEKIRADDIDSITSSEFDASRPTKFIIHGFTDSASATWCKSMVAEFLAEGDYNVLDVDWGGEGGSKTSYTRATANTRIVGAEIAYLLRTMKAVVGLDYSSVHLIGHSLGAHVCGYAGSNITGLGRISGIDPAEPYFEGYKESVRLDPSDAQFVDIIHSDADSILAGGMGSMQPCGHADFYPNGGKDQPNCRNTFKNIIENGLFEGLRKVASCDHARSKELYISSINSCTFTAYQCDNLRDFEHHRCTGKCEGDSCNRMGYHAHKPNHPLTKYYLKTSGDKSTNYCVKTYDFEVTVGSESPDIDGSIDVKIDLSNGKTAELTLNSEEEVLKAGSHHMYRLSLPNIDEKHNVHFVTLSAKWNRNIPWWKLVTKACNFFGICHKSAHLKQIMVTSLMGTRTSYFCGSEDLESGKHISLLYSSKQC